MIRVAGAAIFRKGNVLLAQRPPGDRLAGKWEFPGGKIEPGETDAEALRRELREELGIETEIGDPVSITRHENGGRPIELVVLRVTWRSGRLEPKEHSAVHWVSPENLLAYDLAPADLPAARILADQGQTSCGATLIASQSIKTSHE